LEAPSALVLRINFSTFEKLAKKVEALRLADVASYAASSSKLRDGMPQMLTEMEQLAQGLLVNQIPGVATES